MSSNAESTVVGTSTAQAQAQAQAQGTSASASTSPHIISAEAEYDHVVRDSELFFHLLTAFHSSFSSSSFSIPTLGGRALDLHRLFVEVTSRGGLEKVIRDRQWGEIISACNFPTTVRDGSFLLRKYYLSVLYQFEQAYYFRRSVPTRSTAGSLSESLSTQLMSADIGIKSTATSQQEVSPKIQPGISLVGTIDEKFDNGYVVSVNLGSEQLKGVLYHVPDSTHSSWSSSNTQHPKQEKSRMTLLGPSRPKPTTGSYNFAEKQGYLDKGLGDKEQHATLMLDFRSSQNS